MKKLEEHKVIPDVIRTSPNEILSVLYDGMNEVNLGNVLTPTQVKDMPQIKWNADENSYYTLLMVDPDAPSRSMPMFREVRHWMVTNIKGSNISSGDHVTEYLGSGPPKKTGLHRYIFLLYKHAEKIAFNEPKTEALSRCHRFRFNTLDFAKKYHLGEPIAANFYQAEWDSYVDERNKNIKNCEVL